MDAIRDYYGVKIALYFAWLGFYTNLLIVPSLVGLCTVLYGYFTLDNDIARYVTYVNYFNYYQIINTFAVKKFVMTNEKFALPVITFVIIGV